jgi:uncharacterized protein involved in exopolysaccharide biosynthesis
LEIFDIISFKKRKLMKKQPQMIPIQYIPCEEDEIDLKEIIKTILKYKKFILIFTFSITLIAAIYAFTKTPIYEIKSNIQAGYINISKNSNTTNKQYFLSPYALKIYIESKFDKSKLPNTNYPKVSASIIKNTDILSISIDDYSNQKAKNYLNTIIKSINSKEEKKIKLYKKSILSQIEILKQQIANIKKQIKILNQNLKNIKDINIYQLTLSQINKYQDTIVNLKLKITSLKENISPLNIIKTHIIGNIEQSPYPIKPKKKLIIIIAFITSLILSIFLIFFIEFIKGLKVNS